jgi:hypothetical protein
MLPVAWVTFSSHAFRGLFPGPYEPSNQLLDREAHLQRRHGVGAAHVAGSTSANASKPSAPFSNRCK